MADSSNWSANGTKLAQLINPQVMADMIEKKLVDLIKFSPLATIDATLVGRPGDTISLPSYAYIGDAVAFGECEDVTIKQLTASKKDVKVTKIGVGVELSDEALLSGYGDPYGEAVNQIALSIASKEDADMLATMKTAYNEYHYSSSITADDIADALEIFGEDIEGDKVILVAPATYTALRKADDWCPASEIAAQLIINGAVGMIHGCQVVVSNKLKATNPEAFIVKPGALRIFMKRETLVETDRDIIAKFNVITADKHFATYIYDESKIIRIRKAEDVSGFTVTSAEGSDSGTTAITMSTAAGTGNKLVYKAGSGLALPKVGDVLAVGEGEYANFTSPQTVTTTDGYKVNVIEIDANNKAVKGGQVTADVKP